MAKLGLGLLVLMASAWAGATTQRGCADLHSSLTYLAYYPIRDMRRTVAIAPQKVAMPLPDSASVPVGGRELPPDPDRLMTERERVAARFVSPAPADDSSRARGERHVMRLCTPCHGASLAGDGPVAARFMPPPDLLGATPRSRSDGYIYTYIRYGGPIMPRYGHALSPEATWDVIHYLRYRQQTSPR
jgi:mono/diheme cytochrome c family protein